MIKMLVGAALVMAVLGVALNAIALAFTLHLHQSPNFGFAGG